MLARGGEAKAYEEGMEGANELSGSWGRATPASPVLFVSIYNFRRRSAEMVLSAGDSRRKIQTQHIPFAFRNALGMSCNYIV